MQGGFSFTTVYLCLTAWSRVLFEKLTGSHLVKKFPAICGSRWLVTAFTRARHLPLILSQISPVYGPPIPHLYVYIYIGKGLPQQAEVAQGVPGSLRPWIFLTFGYEGGRSLALRTGRLYPRRNPWYSFLEAESTPGHMVPSVDTGKISSD